MHLQRLAAHPDGLLLVQENFMYPRIAERDALEAVNVCWLRNLTEENYRFSKWQSLPIADRILHTAEPSPVVADQASSLFLLAPPSIGSECVAIFLRLKYPDITACKASTPLLATHTHRMCA